MSSEISSRPSSKRERGAYWAAYYRANKEESATYDRAYRTRPENREKARLRAAEWRAVNKERERNSKRASYLKNRDRRCESVREYQSRNARVVAERRRAYFAAHPWVKRALHAIRRANLLRQRCDCCDRTVLREIYRSQGEIDHKVPLALGGHHCAKNLQVLTRDQHVAKTAIDRRRMADVRLRNILMAGWR